MASWAGAYGAGGGSDALRQLVADRLVQAKFAEEQRQAQAREAADAADRAQRGQQFTANQAMQMQELGDARAARFQMGTQHTEDVNRGLQRQTLEDQIRAKERIEATTQHAGDQAFQAGEAEKGRALQRYLLGQRETGEVQVHWDKDADGNPRAYRVGKDGAVTPIQMPGGAPAGPSKADTFKSDLDTFSTAVYNHPGLSSAGAGLNLGRPYNAEFGNLQGASKQLVNMYLSDPDVRAKIAAMKPATDADVQRALAQAVNIDVEKMDKGAIQHEIDRLRTKAGLKPLGGAGSADEIVEQGGHRFSIKRDAAGNVVSGTPVP